MHRRSTRLSAIARSGLTIFLSALLAFDGVPTAALAQALDVADAVVEEALVEEEVSEEELPEEGLPEEVILDEGLPEQDSSEQKQSLDAEETGEHEALPEEVAEETEPVDDEQEAPADEVAPADDATNPEEASAPEDEQAPALTAQADGDLIASGEWGECSWSIDNDGLLRIWPTNGTSGALAESTRKYGSYFPWLQYAESIRFATVEKGVTLRGSLEGMFYKCPLLESLDVSGWDTSSVTSMNAMFYGCSSLASLDVSGWDTSSVTYMGYMFYGCSSLASLDVSGWDTSSVTQMWYMFYGCSSLASLDVSGWDTSSVTIMNYMFYGCSSLASLDVSGWDTSSVTNMGHMFRDCSSLASLDVSGWDISSVVYMECMFRDCSSLASLDVSGWDTSSVRSMAYMFYGCSSLASLDVSGWDISSVMYMECMFRDCSSLASLDVSGWDTSSVRSMVETFDSCSALVSLDVSSWDTSSVTKMTRLFRDCSSLASLDVSGWDTSSVTEMIQAFQSCSSLASLDVSGWDTSSVKDMAYMFRDCSSLASLDVSGWDTSSVTNVCHMFNGCTSLESLDLSTWSSKSLRISADMLSNLSNLSTLSVGTGFDLSGVFPSSSREDGMWWSEAEAAWFDAATIRSERACYADTYVTCRVRGNLRAAEVTFAPAETVYDGTQVCPSISLSFDGQQLVEGVDYTIMYEGNTNAGTAIIKAVGMGEWQGEVKRTFEIARRPVTVTAQSFSKTYGEPDPVFTAMVEGLLGGDTVEYNLARKKGEAPGSYAIMPTGDVAQGNYTITFQGGTLTIVGTSIQLATFAEIPNQTYTGSALTPKPLVTLGGTTLSLGTDYSLSYRNNVNVGTATVVISGKGGYVGSLSETFVISPKAATVTADSLCKELGQADPALTATVEGLVGNDRLAYTLSREAGESLGTYAITATGDALQGNYCVTYKPGVLTIGLVSIARATIDEVPQCVYDGTSQVPKVMVTLDGKTLVESRDYTLAYRNNVNPGTATVIVRGTGDYDGSVEATFVIAPKPVTVTANSMSKTLGDPDPVLTATVKGVVGGDTISYKLSRKAGELPGTYAITASGDEAQGNYLVTFVGGQLVIDKAAAADVVVEPIADEIYSGVAIEPELSVSVRGIKLERGRDYTVSFADNTNAGQASAVVTGTGAFEGSITCHFTITPREATVRALHVTKTYGDADPLLRASISGTLGNDTVSYEVTREPGENVGAYAVTPKGDELQGNYQVAFVYGVLEVTPRAVTVTPDDQSKAYGEPDPELTATIEGLLNSDTVSYSLSRERGETPATYEITASGDELQGNYRVSYGRGTFTVVARDIASAEVSGLDVQAFNGNPKQPRPTVKLGDKTLELGLDYTVSYRDCINPGTATVIVSGKGNYTGTKCAYFDIVAPASEFLLRNGQDSYVYNFDFAGAVRTHSFVLDSCSYVTCGVFYSARSKYDEALSVYLVAPDGSLMATKELYGNAGKGTLGTYALWPGEWKIVTVVRQWLNYQVVRYDAIPIDDGSIGIRGLGFDVEDERGNDALSPATASIVSGMRIFGSLRDAESSTWIDRDTYLVNIESGDDLLVSYAKPGQTYEATLNRITGDELENVRVDTIDEEKSIYYGELPPGRYALTLLGALDEVEAGSLDDTYSFLPLVGLSASRAEVSVKGDHVYSGQAVEPDVEVRLDGVLLNEGIEYEVAYENNVNAGTAKVVVSGKGYYSGTGEATFDIAPKPVTVKATDASKVYGDADPELTATVEGLLGSDTVEYAVARETGEAVGAYAIDVAGDEVQGGGNYTVAFVPGTLTISTRSITSATIAGIAAKTYTGKALTPKPTVVLRGATLSEGVDYGLTYKNNVKAGTATITVTGKGNYTGTRSINFTIAKAANPFVAKATKSTVQVPYSTVKTKAVVTAKNVTVSGLKEKARLTYGKVSGSAALTIAASTGKVTVKKGTKAGTYSIKVKVTSSMTANYKATTKYVTYKVKVYSANAMTAKANNTSLTASFTTLKSRAVVTAKNVTVSNAKGTVTYANASSNATSKKFTVNKTTGKVTVPKGTKKGTYQVKIKVTAAGTSVYAAKSVTVTYNVVVK